MMIDDFMQIIIETTTKKHKRRKTLKKRTFANFQSPGKFAIVVVLIFIVGLEA